MPLHKRSLPDLVIDVAGTIQSRILGIYTEKTGNHFDIISNEDALPFDSNFIEKATKPSRHTLLHKYIESYLDAEYYYGARKYEENFIPMAHTILEAYNIEFSKEEFTGRCSNYKLYNKAIPAFGLLAHDTFAILFKDRELMRNFSRLVSSLHQHNFPRATYWPKWLKDAIIHRDFGRCGICFRDLSGLIAIDHKIHIDHMIPISLRGTNDPTNLQILCDECNLMKGNRNDDTSPIHHTPWNLSADD